jgi:hypothetical protein
MAEPELGPSQTPGAGYIEGLGYPNKDGVYPNPMLQGPPPSEQNRATISDAGPRPAREPSCWNPKFGQEQTTVGPVTHTGPGGQIRIGECSGEGTFDLNGEVSAGKATTQGGVNTYEVEGPNAKAGLSINPRGESRIGAQANVASASLEGKQKDGSTQKIGASAGVGAELRVHGGPNGIEGAGADVGPVSFDEKNPQAPLRVGR